MGMNWGMLLTIFLAIVLAEIFVRGTFSGGSIGGTPASVGAMMDKNPASASPTVIYANPIMQYIAEKYPNASR